MRLETFKSQLKRLSANMGRQIPIENVELIYSEISWIPDEAMPDLVSMALEKWDTWPRNFPKAIMANWYEWQEKRKALPDQVDCMDCYNNTGLIHAWKRPVMGQDRKGNDIFHPLQICHTFRCGSCENWAKYVGKKIPQLTKKELQDRGYKIEQPVGWKADRKKVENFEVKEIPDLPNNTDLTEKANEQVQNLRKYCDEEKIPF